MLNMHKIAVIRAGTAGRPTANSRACPAWFRTVMANRPPSCPLGVCRITRGPVVAQDAGDRPDLYAARMRWARRAVAVAYLDRFTDDGGLPALPGPVTARLGARALSPAGITG
jgi:hypothetical protein